jgi:cobalt-zinc-cadmium efflux system outer membrane protein
MALAGCAGVPPDRGYGEVRRMAADRGQAMPDDVDADRSALVGKMLAKPLGESDAVQVALISNPAIRAEYARLGLSGAEIIQAGRLSNPTLSAGWQGSSLTGDVSRYDFGLTQDFAELLLLPARSRFGKGEFERAKLDATQAMLDLAARVRSAYYDAVGARQVAAMRQAIAAAANAAAELAERANLAGNNSALELALDQAAASQAVLEQERAEADAARARSVLNELMGLAPAMRWEVAGALPMPLQDEDSLDELQKLASLERPDLESDRRAVALLGGSLGVTRRYRMLGSVDAGVQYERDTDRNRLFGPSLSLQLPVFNQGQAAVLRAEAELDSARSKLRAKELEVSNGVQAAYDRVMAARKRLDRLRTQTIPLREKIVARMQEQVNYMLVGIFDLLRARQDEYGAYQQYLEAVRDYWQARADLEHAVGGRLPSDARVGEPVVAPELPAESLLPDPTPHEHDRSSDAPMAPEHQHSGD